MTTYAISSITKANPAVITCAAHPFVTGDRVQLNGMTAASWAGIVGMIYPITYLGSTSFSIPLDASGFAAAATDGTAALPSGLTYTLLDAKQAVWVLCYGQKFAETEAGNEVITDAINRAQAAIPAKLGSLQFAGDLLKISSAKSANGTTDNWSLAGDGFLVPITAEIMDSATTRVTAAFCTPERLLAISRKAIPGKSINFAFMGGKVYARPLIPNTGSIQVYGIKVPISMTSDTDILEADPRLFDAICLSAAYSAMQKLPSIPEGRLQTVQNDMNAELTSLMNQVKLAQLEEYAMRTGRDPLFEGRAPGQGG